MNQTENNSLIRKEISEENAVLAPTREHIDNLQKYCYSFITDLKLQARFLKKEQLLLLLTKHISFLNNLKKKKSEEDEKELDQINQTEQIDLPHLSTFFDLIPRSQNHFHETFEDYLNLHDDKDCISDISQALSVQLRPFRSSDPFCSLIPSNDIPDNSHQSLTSLQYRNFCCRSSFNHSNYYSPIYSRNQENYSFDDIS